MSLASGDKLGPYEILSPLGKGGMGEVWKAHDPRLRRDVAIKISAEHFSERFEREAHAIAALNHPHICQIYDVGPNYLVMEFVEGTPLVSKKKAGPLPLDEALRIARQIAAALEAAHEKHITHRDLKPGNIMLKPDGTVKVLDFGLAKITTPVRTDLSPENSPTLTLAATQMGMILGTAAYMAPEQAKGKEVDKRADIWAFGVVFYELVTGSRPFHGADMSEILASVIKENPSYESVPYELRRLLKKCMEKDPARRLRDIGDVWELLEEAAPLPAAQKRPMLPWVVAAVLTVAAVIGMAGWYRATLPVDRPLIRLDVDLGADVAMPPPTNGGSSIALSPDGTKLVYASGTPPRLFVRRLDQARATELPGTENGSRPIFSPDGQWVGFVARGKLNKISVEGGGNVVLADIANFVGWNWGDDGSFVVSENGKGLMRIPPGGGQPELILPVNDHDVAFPVPQILPGSKAVLIVAAGSGGGVEKNTIEVLTLSDHRRKVVVRGGHNPRFVPSAGASSSDVGHLIYNVNATLYAVPFDPAKLEMRGPEVPVLDDVAISSLSVGQFDFSGAPSGHGTMVYRGAGDTASLLGTLQWVDASGKKKALMLTPGIYTAPVVSPDGRRIAMQVVEGGSWRNIWVYDEQRERMTRLTSSGTAYSDSVWSPDGQHMVFRVNSMGIAQARADGSGQVQELIVSRHILVPRSFSPDGQRLAYTDGTTGQLWTVPMEEQGGQLKAGKPEQFLKSTSNDGFPSFSPDGRWLAYQSDESGKNEVYVRPFPPPASGLGGKWPVSNNGGTLPRWSRAGHELMYQSGDQIMAASYAVKGETFVAEKARVWIPKLGSTDWDLSPDGKRVVVATPVETPGGSGAAPKKAHEVVMLQNFFDELRRKAPLGK